MKQKKLKILICTQEHPPGGSGIAFVVFNLAKELRKKGMIVHVCSPVGPEVKLGSAGLIEKTGGFGLLLFWRKAAEYINENWKKYDLIWNHNPLFLTRIKARNVINTTHTTYRERIKTLKRLYVPFYLKFYNSIMRFFEKLSYRKMRSFDYTVTSRLTRKELIKLGVKGKFYLVPNGADLNVFNACSSKQLLRKKLKIPGNAKVLVNVGRMMPQKNHIQLVKVFSSMEKLDKNLYLILIGSGPLRAKIEEEIMARNAKNILLTGRIKQSLLSDYYKCSDFFVSASSYEGQPLSLLEALACGLIPIVSKIPIFNDVINEVGKGLLTDFNENKANAIYDFIRKSNINKDSGIISVYTAKHYSWKIIADRYIQIFRKMVKK